jgi:hypothetical protein
MNLQNVLANAQVWFSAAAFLMGALNAWQNKNISAAILGLKLELSERIWKTEGDVKALTVGGERNTADIRNLSIADVLRSTEDARRAA